MTALNASTDDALEAGQLMFDHAQGLDGATLDTSSDAIAFARRQVEDCALGQPECSRETGTSIRPDVPGYSIVREIHRGGQGVVYEAAQDHPHRRVAIKFLRDGIAASRADLMRFRREADILARIRHPNIVTIYEAGVASGTQYFVMDYIAGLPLDEYVRYAALSVEDTVRLFLAVCDAVGAAHQHGVLHRDLKPSNIRVDERGEPHILDFGLAVDTDGADSSLTITGQFIGSLPWASPEQATREPGWTDVRADIYTIGVVLYHALTERFPYDVVGPPSSVLAAIMNAEPIRPSAFRPEIPYDLEQIILKCLSKDPRRRYQSVSELSADGRRFLAHEPITARRDSTWYLFTKAMHRHRRASAIMIAVILIAMIYGATITVLYRRALVAEANARTSTRQAQHQFENARTAYETLLEDIAKQERIAGTAPTRRGLSAAAYRGLSDLISQDPADRPVSAALAVTLCKLGEFASELGRNDEALHHFRRAADIREALVRERPDDLALQADLSINLVREGDVTKDSGNISGAQAFYEKALTIDQHLVLTAPNDVHFLDNLAWSYQRLAFLARDRGESELAESYFREQLIVARRAFELEPHNATRLDTLLDAELRQIQDFQSPQFSLGNATICLKAAQARLLCDPDDAAARDALTSAEQTKERVRVQSQLVAQVMKPWIKTIVQVSGTSLGDPHNARRLIERLRDYAYCAHQAGLDDDSTEVGKAALTLASDLVQTDSDVIENLALLASVHSWEMDRARENGDFSTALLHAQSSAKYLGTAVQEAPKDRRLLHETFLAQHSIGANLLSKGQEGEANEAMRAAMTAAEDALNAGLMSPEFMMDYGKVITEPESLGYRDIDRGLDLMEKAIENSRPGDALLLDQIGNAALAAGRKGRACAAFAASLQSRESRDGYPPTPLEKSQNP